jgi:H+-translocating NAD(P) transhydrogenase subunit beta
VIAATFLQDADFISSCYIVAFALFIYGLMQLRHPRTAVRGNLVAAVGMAIAVAATLLIKDMGNWGLIVAGIVIGTVIGVPAARTVKMTAMPQMVALFNGVGGGAVALIAWVEFRNSGGYADDSTYVALFSLFGAIVGSVSFWGSNIAFGKLQELIPGRPISLGRAQQFVNAILLVAALAFAVAILSGSHSEGLIVGVLIAAALLGNFVVLPIGGADMPVVISLLNAFTGLAAAATGFELENNVLIVSGMLVGASGTLLTMKMGQAMNRSITNVLFGAFGQVSEQAEAVASGAGGGTVRSATSEDVAVMLAYARKVVFVPGYGLAVAQAQHDVRALADILEEKGVEVTYAIHPVAGRMPGHMNVLLAEANVPYDQLKEMDDANPEFSRTDVVVVVGANDVVNPDARNNAGSPIYGMPILNVDDAQTVVVLKRSMNPGFAGIENPLFYNPKTVMLFGDAKASIVQLQQDVKAV